MWCVRAGKTGEADQLFLNKGYVAIGWVKMGNLGTLPPDREVFKTKYVEAYPDAKPGAVPTSAGQAFRFVHEMKKGDLVVYPSKKDQQIHLGRVTGAYEYKPRLDREFPQMRRVKWLQAAPRSQFSKDALNELGSALTLFQVKTHAGEFLALLEGEATTPLEEGQIFAALRQRLVEVISDSEGAWDQRVESYERQIEELGRENAELRNKLDAGIAPVDEIMDDVLRKRMSYLKNAPRDTLIREAGAILEDRLRQYAGETGRTEHGVKLAEHVLKAPNAKLEFSTHSGEQLGVMHLYRGAMQFIRNPPMHKLMDYPESTARLLIRLIDSLLRLLDEGKGPDTATADAVRKMLTRIPIADGQMALYKALYAAGDAGMTQEQLSAATGRSARELSGVMGALGRRINNTEGLEGLGTGAVLDCRWGGSGWWYQMLPLLREALEAEGLV